MKILPEKADGYKMQINTLLILNPKLSIRQVVTALKDAGIELDKDYVHKLIKEIEAERSTRYAEKGKEETLAMMEDLATWVITQLRSIIQEETNVYKGKDRSIEAKIISQANRIKALDTIFKTAERVLNMKMDLGIFERQLGKLTQDSDIRQIRVDLLAYRKKRKDEKDRDTG